MHSYEYWNRRNAWEKEWTKTRSLESPKLSDELSTNPLDTVRLKFIDFFSRSSVVLVCHGNCFRCNDFQVVSCMVDNLDVLEDIGITLKEEVGHGF